MSSYTQETPQQNPPQSPMPRRDILKMIDEMCRTLLQQGLINRSDSEYLNNDRKLSKTDSQGCSGNLIAGLSGTLLLIILYILNTP